MKRLLIITAVALALAGCTNPSGAREALLDAGYTNIEIGGYDAWGCGEDDTFATKFTATGPTGRQVRGVVCAGAFKGETIRLKRGA